VGILLLFQLVISIGPFVSDTLHIVLLGARISLIDELFIQNNALLINALAKS